MKYTVAVLACVFAAACAQFSNGQYNAYNNGRYNPNPYNAFGNNQYNRNPYRYRPYTTPAPYKTYRPVSVTPTVTIAPSAFPVTTPAPTYNPVPSAVPVSRIVSDDRNAEIVKLGNEVNPDGSYSYFYETSNGIAAQEQGVPRDFGGNPPVVPDVAQGSFSWTSPEGQPIAISYIADENGYQPSGSAIPTAPPLPEQIARALDYIARNAPAVQKK